jgi:hypothetical protein
VKYCKSHVLTDATSHKKTVRKSGILRAVVFCMRTVFFWSWRDELLGVLFRQTPDDCFCFAENGENLVNVFLRGNKYIAFGIHTAF